MGAREDPDAKNRPKIDPIGHAEELHRRYVTALTDWIGFQRAQGEKVVLWSAIERIIINSNRKDGFLTEAIYEALGVNAYHERVGHDWSGEGTLVEALLLQSEFGALGGQTGIWLDDGPIADEEPVDNEFVELGRDLLVKRTRVEVAAERLIHFMKFGREPELLRSEPLPGGYGVVTHSEVELSQPILEFEPEGNGFYRAFLRRPFPEQVKIAKTLTEDLARCHRGRVFLANLFDHREREIFDPFGFVRPKFYMRNSSDDRNEKVFLEGQEAVEAGERRFVSVFAKHEAELNRYFAIQPSGAYRLRTAAEQPLGTEHLEPHLTQLIRQLLPGLYQYHATRSTDANYMDAVERGIRDDPQDVVKWFLGFTTGVFLTDDQIRAAMVEIDWDGQPFSAFEWGDHLHQLQVEGESAWTSEEAAKLSMVLLVAADKVFEKAKSQIARRTGPLRLLLVELGGLASAVGALDALGASEQLAAISAMGRGLIDSADLLTRHLGSEVFDEVGEYIVARSRQIRNRLVGLSRKSQTFVTKASPALDVFDVFVNSWRMIEEFQSGDDAGWGYGTLAASNAASLGSLYFTSVANATAAGAVGSGGWVAAYAAPLAIWLFAIAIVLLVVGMIVVALLDDPPIADWVKTTYFGTEWADLNENASTRAEHFVDPMKPTFGYRRLDPGQPDMVGEVDFQRQVSELYTNIRPLGLKQLQFGEEDGRHYGQIEIEPGTADNRREPVPIREDGFLFLRPIPVVRNNELGLSPVDPVDDDDDVDSDFQVVEDVSGEYLHRFSLAEEKSEAGSRSKTNGGPVDDQATALAGEAGPLGPLVKRWFDVDITDSPFELEIRERETTDTENGETLITKWTARIWDTSGGEHVDSIFGWSKWQMSALSVWTYVEVLYVPPSVVESIRRDGMVWVRPQEIPVASRERNRILGLV